MCLSCIDQCRMRLLRFVAHPFSTHPALGDDAIRYFRAAGYQFLAIEPEHAAAIEALPKHHQDPFDRLLVAQALIEPMHLLTHDDTISRYSDTIVLV